MKAICLRCGVPKAGPLVPCRSCGHVPVGDERPVAWLLSDHHLTPPELAVASKRIRQGLILRPPPELVEEAREEMNRALPGRRKRPKQSEPDTAYQKESWTPEGTPEGSPEDLILMDSYGPPGGALSPSSVGLLVIVNLLASPLVGWMIWAIWRRKSPAAARQVFQATLPITIIVAITWLGMMAAYWSKHQGFY